MNIRISSPLPKDAPTWFGAHSKEFSAPSGPATLWGSVQSNDLPSANCDLRSLGLRLPHVGDHIASNVERQTSVGGHLMKIQYDGLRNEADNRIIVLGIFIHKLTFLSGSDCIFCLQKQSNTRSSSKHHVISVL